MKPVFPLLIATLLPLSAAPLASGPPALDFAAAPADEPGAGAYTWHEALEACERRGMVLPSLQEVGRLFCHADLEQKAVVPEFPQTDGGCRESGISETIGNFNEGARYWTSSRYNARLVRYVDFADGRSGYYGTDQKLHVRCVVPREDGSHDKRSTSYDINDMDRASFDRIIDTLFGLYAGEFGKQGKELIVNKRWEKDQESALSWLTEGYDRNTQQIHQTLEIELMGGLARHPMLNRDAFAMVVCHEIGHHLGGAPHAMGYSSEGQADYFAAAKCMKRYLKAVTYPQENGEALPNALEGACRKSFDTAREQTICRRNIGAGHTLSRWFAHVKEVELPDPARRDPARPSSTVFHGYPSPQCRLDTFIAGALCPVDETVSFSADDARVGACAREAGLDRGARPRCWFNGEETPQKPDGSAD